MIEAVAPGIIYALCGVTSVLCAFLMWRSYARKHQRLLLLVGLCFAGLAVNNVLLFVDLVVVPTVDLSVARGAVGLASIGSLLFVLIWEAM